MSAHAPTPSPAIQAAMDRVLTTHGAYIPLELLMTLGRLRYTEYEAWRCGERASLQSALAGNPRRIVAQLEEAAAWAGRLGLVAAPQTYFGWGRHAHRRLVFFDAELRASEPVLTTHYVRPAADDATAVQFDLFLDSGPTAVLQDLRTALLARDPRAAERALAALVASDPGHRQRPAAERLTDALAHLSTPLSPPAAEAELRAVEEGLLPAARDLLGANARDLLAPFWQRLAAALDGVPFDPERPALHASYAHARCLDWSRAIAAIEAEPGHAAQPVLLARLAEARRHDGDRQGAIAAWCRLCWRAPEIAGSCLDDPELPDPGVHRSWLAYLDLDADAQAGPEYFPAYLLLAEPGLARALAVELADDDSRGENAFRALHRLRHEDTTADRKALREAAPWLLEAYLQARAGNR